MARPGSKSVVYLVVGLGTVIIGILVALLVVYRNSDLRIERAISGGYQQAGQYSGLTINYPLDETLFPPEIVPPTFRWQDGDIQSNTWLIVVEFHDDQRPLTFLADDTAWPVPDKQWQVIKNRSVEKPAKVTILGVDRKAPQKILSAGSITISTSKDPVGAPIFYREVHLPFIEAVKDPTPIQWRFGSISSPHKPRIVLSGLPTCANCHSFTPDGKTLAMEIDSANDKGSYAIVDIQEQMVLDNSTIMTWSDYKREEKERTFGLLAQIAPDGKNVICMVKDRSVFVPRPDLAFSQLFFPIKGILVVYNRETETFKALPGADDKRYVQANPSWSPDGKEVIFAKSEVYTLKNLRDTGRGGGVLLTPEECKEFFEEGKTFRYDLYRIPYNNGEGGQPVPVEGAWNNGMSNYFAKYSPDGKWIVFCKANSFMLLQPDSKLYIIPAQGGKARKLRCNTNRMNSWHSWSPNSRWLVFSSKANSAYTQLFLTHIDDNGISTPPVLLEQFTATDRAANIPEFVNTSAEAIKEIRQEFINDHSYLRAAEEFTEATDFEGAAKLYRKALKINPRNVIAHIDLGTTLMSMGQFKQARVHLDQAIALDPNNATAYNSLGLMMYRQEKFEQAIKYYSQSVDLKPDRFKTHYNLGLATFKLGQFDQTIKHLSEAVRLEPEHAKAHYNLGLVYLGQGRANQALEHLSRTVQLEPQHGEAVYSLIQILTKAKYPDLCNVPEAIEVAKRYCQATNYRRPEALDLLASCYAEGGQFAKAISTADKALYFARAAGKNQLAGQIAKRIGQYKSRQDAATR